MKDFEKYCIIQCCKMYLEYDVKTFMGNDQIRVEIVKDWYEDTNNNKKRLCLIVKVEKENIEDYHLVLANEMVDDSIEYYILSDVE